MTPADTRTAGPRVRRRSFAGPMAALGLVLVALVPIVGTDAVFSADEGAALAQAELLSDGTGWAMAHPVPEIDPDGAAFPLEGSARVRGGYAPFAKHSLYPLVLAPALRTFGLFGPMALSLLGTVAAAGLGAHLARRIDERLAVPTLWVIGLASPLLFDGYLALAHSWGAAAATASVLVALAAIDAGRPAYVGAVVALMAGAALLRNEAALFGLALALVLLGFALRRRDRVAAWAGLGAGVGAGAGLLIDRWLTDVVVGTTDSTGLAVGGDVGLLPERLSGLVVTWFLPSYDAGGLGAGLVAGSVAAAVAAAIVTRRRPQDTDGIRLLAGLAVGAAVARLVLAPPEIVPGLLMAFPLLAVGLAVMTGEELRGTGGIALATVAVFAVGVVVTQYEAGGSGEWGGRYFALGLPVVVPVVLAGLDRAGRRLDPSTRRQCLASLVVLSLAFSGLAVASLRAARQRNGALVRAVASAAPAPERGVVVSTAGALPRLAWDRRDEARWLFVPPDHLDRYLAQLAEAEIDEVTVAARDGHLDDVVVIDYRIVGDTEPIDGWRLLQMRRS